MGTTRTPRLTAFIIRAALQKGIPAGLLYKGLIDCGYPKREIAQGFYAMLEQPHDGDIDPCP